MEIKAFDALQNYTLSKSVIAPNGSGENDFTFANLVENFTGTLNRHEQTARAAMTGQADPHALVEALASSQMAVDTVTAIRDKVVEAYQEIMRMPV